MQIEIHIFPNSFSSVKEEYDAQMTKLRDDVFDFIGAATLSPKRYTVTNNTFLDDNGFIIATVRIKP